MGLLKRAKIWLRPPHAASDKSPLPAFEQQQVVLADLALKFVTYRWFEDTLSIEANRILPALLLQIFVGEKLGLEISKSRACEPLRIDPTKTGSRYIAMAQEHGFAISDHRLELYGTCAECRVKK